MAGYIRQSAADIVTGAVVLAAPLNNEFNALAGAFHLTTGHTHDGSAGNGPTLSIATSISGLAAGVATFLGTPSSANLLAAVTNETGTGSLVFATSPRFTTNIAPLANDSAALGTTSLAWADLFLSLGGIIDWSAGDARITHSTGVLNVSAGDLRVTTAGTNTASVVLVGGTQTLTSKTISFGSNTISGTTAQFNTALSDGDFATLAGTEVLTGKTINLTSNTLSGTKAQFDTALSDDNFAYLGAANTFTDVQTITSASAGTFWTLESTDAGAGAGPNIELYRNSATPAANDFLGILFWYGKDSAGNKEQYGAQYMQVLDTTSTSEDAKFIWEARSAGTGGFKMQLSGGLWLGPSTSDPGIGEIAVSGIDILTGGTINFASSNWVATHTSGILTVGTGDLRVTTAGTNTASVVTVGGTQTLTGKTATGLITTAGTTSVASLVLTAGTNLTTAAAGAVEHDGKAFYATSIASTRQVIATKQLVTNAAVVALTNNITTVQSIFPAANDTLTVAASTAYRFRGRFGFNTGATSHTKTLEFGGTATFTSIGFISIAYPHTIDSNAAYMTRHSSATSLGPSHPASTVTQAEIWIEGVMRVNGAGTIIPQVKFSAGPTGTCETVANSFFEIEPIGINTVEAVGNWA